MQVHSAFILFLEIDRGILNFMNSPDRPNDVQTVEVFCDKFDCSVMDIGLENTKQVYENCFLNIEKIKKFHLQHLQKYFP